MPFRILIILHNSMIFTPKSEVGFCVGWSERKRTKRRSNTEYSECNFAKQNKMSDYGVWSNNPIQFSGKSLPWVYFINIFLIIFQNLYATFLKLKVNIVFRTLLKSVFAILNRYDWLCVWVVPASPSLRVGILKSPQCPVIRI